jgi:undecaprenyl-diphosphatase
MDLIQAIVLAIVEGITEFLPVSSTAHMIFTSSIFQTQGDEFVKMFQVSIQFGAILSVVFLYRKKFLNLRSFNFYIKLGIAVIPALVLGKLFDDSIEAVLEKPLPIAVVLIVGGCILLVVDRYFKNTTIETEDRVSTSKALTIGLWQCLAMMPGTSRSAASIIGGMQQGLTRKMAAEFSFFLAVPTMLAVTCYSLFLKDWDFKGQEMHGYEMISSSTNNMLIFVLGNIIAFVVAIVAIRFFISLIEKFGFRIWGWYRIVVGVILILLFTI